MALQKVGESTVEPKESLWRMLEGSRRKDNISAKGSED
jgi:hypothetical protein